MRPRGQADTRESPVRAGYRFGAPFGYDDKMRTPPGRTSATISKTAVLVRHRLDQLRLGIDVSFQSGDQLIHCSPRYAKDTSSVHGFDIVARVSDGTAVAG